MTLSISEICPKHLKTNSNYLKVKSLSSKRRKEAVAFEKDACDVKLSGLQMLLSPYRNVRLSVKEVLLK